MSTLDDFESTLVARAEGWLGRQLVASDGVSVDPTLPRELSIMYRRVGRIDALMHGFESFRDPEQCELIDDRLVFLNENQGACNWGVDRDGHVWMLTDDGFTAEDIGLADFLLMVLPYQLAQGGLPHCSQGEVPAGELRAELSRLAGRYAWTAQVDRNGLLIYGSGGHLLWALEPEPGDPTALVYLSSRDEGEFARLTEELGFDEL